MNYSIYSADRTTHLKIVIVGLMAAIAVMGISISARVQSNVAAIDTPAVIKAARPVVMTNSANTLIR